MGGLKKTKKRKKSIERSRVGCKTEIWLSKVYKSSVMEAFGGGLCSRCRLGRKGKENEEE